MTTGTCLWGLKSPRIRSIKRDWHMKLCNFWAGFYRQNANKLEMYKRNDGEMCQFSWIFFIVLRGKVSVRPAWKMSLEPGLKLTATDGREAKVKRQWVPDNWSCDETSWQSRDKCVTKRPRIDLHLDILRLISNKVKCNKLYTHAAKTNH